MDVTVDNVIDEMIRSNKIDRFTSELQHTESEDRKNEIKAILGTIQGINTTETRSKDKLDEIYQSIIENSLKKRWNRLQQSQKIDRIRTYLQKLIPDENNRKEIEDVLNAYLIDGTLTEKFVKYDQNKMEIVSISELEYDSEDDVYQMKQHKSKKSKSKKVVVDESDSE
jgi:hypothetical protein